MAHDLVFRIPEGCDKVIVCVRSQDSKKFFEKVLEGTFGDDVLQKVSFEILGDFVELEQNTAVKK